MKTDSKTQEYVKNLSDNEMQDAMAYEVLNYDYKTDLYKALCCEQNRRYKARTGFNGGSR